MGRKDRTAKTKTVPKPVNQGPKLGNMQNEDFRKSKNSRPSRWLDLKIFIRSAKSWSGGHLACTLHLLWSQNWSKEHFPKPPRRVTMISLSRKVQGWKQQWRAFNCVTRAPLLLLRSWVALSLKVCESVRQSVTFRLETSHFLRWPPLLHHLLTQN